MKPKLFGDSLGVSGLWILIGIVAGGKMFGVIGILLAIPTIAIIDMLYHDFFLPFMERPDRD
ncbi:MAG: AI-2E family transporter [Pseudobutyrivibrio sp.]|nr:AI-2E family transporter [Pseudobutyrivibrio sp.]